MIKQFLIVFGFFSILPFLILSFFNHPLGVHEWDWITKMGGQLDSLGFWEMQWHAYQEWTGRYASTFISALTPYVYSLIGFKLFFFINFLLGIWIIYISLRELLKVKERLTLISLSFLVWMSFVAGVSGIYDTFYMLTGVHTYAFGAYAFLLLLVQWKKYATSLKKRWIRWMIFLLSFLAVGMNELTMVFTVLLNIFMFFYQKYYFKRIDLFSLFIIILTITFSLFTVLAPANMSRHVDYPGVFHPLNLTLLSIATSTYNLISWLINGQLIAASIIFIYLVREHLDDHRKSLRFIVTGFIFGIIVFVFGGHLILILSLKAQSLGERIIDLIYIHFLLLWFSFIYFLAGVYREKIKKLFSMPEMKFTVVAIIMIFIFSVFGSGLHINRQQKKFDNYISLSGVHTNVGNAWLTLINGEAVEYDQRMRDQYLQISLCKTDTCFVERPEKIPAMLYDRQADRRNLVIGESFMGKYFNPNVEIVKYIK